MAIDPILYDLFDAQARICKVASSHSDGYTQRTWQTTSNGTLYQCHIERKEETIRLEDGRNVVSHRKVFLYSSTSWSSTSIPRTIDKLILPATHPPVEPQILGVQPVSDENGIHHVMIWA